MNGFAYNILKANQSRLDCVAIIDRDGQRKTTWRQLNRLILKVASYARKQQLSGIVPVHMDRGMEALASILGLSLAGVGVAPLALSTPEARCEAIANQVRNAIWDENTFLKSCRCEISFSAETDAAVADPVLVVFTSGSTGNPKGVMLNNRAVQCAIDRDVSPNFLDLEPSDRYMQTTSLSFVAIILDCFCPLYAGCTLYFLPEEARKDIRLITEYINRFSITKMIMPPQMYRRFEGAESLKLVATGSDVVVNIAPKGHKLKNFYGMSEMACIAFYYEIKQALPYSLLGEPAPEFSAYVLDEAGNPAEEGELCVSGPVASAYLDMPELTAETFTPNPFSDDPDHAILLHTGDLVQKVSEGGYRYLGRKDNMIKINGQRVEPGEIERTLLDYEGITAAVVKGFPLENQHTVLCAYYTCSQEPDEEKLRRFLASKLPNYMVPGVFVKLDAMPLNANGKLDRKSLLLPDMNSYQGVYEEPQNDTEALLCSAFEKVLSLSRVGRNDDFFRLGGDSILALQVAQLCEIVGLTPAVLFDAKTPKAIAVMLGNSESETAEDLPRDVQEAPLTSSQMGIFLDCVPDEECKKYNIPIHISFDRKAGMTPDSIRKALDAVLKSHPALYSRIVLKDETAYMQRQDFPADGMCVVRECTDEEAQAFVESFIVPIAITKGPLCMVSALLGSQKVHIYLNMHHVVTDGTSVSILCRQIAEALSGKMPESEETDAFALSVAETRLQKGTGYEEAKLYFEKLLSGVETDSNLLPDAKGAEGALHPSVRVDRILRMPGLTAFLSQYGITESTFFMGVYAYTLAKMTGQSESMFTVAENGRSGGHLDNTVSMLVKTLPVSIRINENEDAGFFLSELQKQFFSTLRNDRYPFTEIAKEYGTRSDVMFVYQSELFAGVDADAIHLDVETLSAEEAIANLSMQVLKQNDGYCVQLEYRSDLYKSSTILRFVELYQRVANEFLAEKPLKMISLLSEKERIFLDTENRNGHVEIPQQETVVDLFRNTVKRLPDKVALRYKEKQYTYAQVDAITERLAAYIRSREILPNQVVSVLIHRGEFMMLASIGILKAGAGYQPLDPSYPPERLSFMVHDSNAALMIADRSLIHLVGDYDGPVLYVDEIESLPETTEVFPSPKPDDIFVLLYTSGTTGTPKGCVLTHANMDASTHAHFHLMHLDESCTVASYASYGFDAHMWDLYPAIANGCTFTIIPDEIRLDLPAVKEFCERENVTHLFMTTQVGRQFATQYSEVRGLRCLSTAGEKLVSFVPHTGYTIMNLYGPTEGTVCTSGFTVDKYYENIPIGRPLKNMNVYFVDSFGRRVPVGVPGELIICGPQVAHGYLNRPEQTEKSFVPNSFEYNVSEMFSRCYRTGDIVRILEDGNIEFIGRRDHQIKIRGFRIELSEVEHAIREYQDIADATVQVYESEGTKHICAYVVSPKTINAEELGRFIAQSHPAYMVPDAIMQLDSIPLNVNGKVDKRKLPKPQRHFEDTAKPENETQKKIHDCAASILGTSEFGIHTDLFLAGLSSIGSIQLCSQLADAFGIAFRIRDLKRAPTVEKLEAFVLEHTEPPKAEEAPTEPAREEHLPEYGPDAPISKTMEGVFVECVRHPDSTIYNVPFLMKLGPGVQEDRMKKAIVATVEAHPCIRTELFTNAEGKVRQHMRTDTAFTESDICLIKAEKFSQIKDTLVTPFKLTGAPLFKIALIHAEALYFFLDVHHIIADGTSFNLFLADVEKAYRGEALQKEEYTGFDVARDEESDRTPEEIALEKEYYSNLLEGVDKDFLPLPDQYENHGEPFGKLSVRDAEANVVPILRYCEKHKIGANAFFLSVFGFVLSKYSGEDYSVFNTVYNGRNDSRKANTFAMLVKTLPVVCRTDCQTVTELLHATSDQLLNSMANDLYSYAEISREFDLRNDIMFIFQGGNFEHNTFANEKAEEIQLPLSETRTPVSLQVLIQDGKLVYVFEYDRNRYTDAFASAFVNAFDHAAASFIRQEELSRISLLSEKAEQAIERFNQTEMPYDQTKTIVDFFRNSVREQPEHLCVAFKDKKLNFAQVNDLSGRLARFLMEKEIGSGDVVAILINRDENMVITAHGVIRTGAAYLGLDPTYPPDRLAFMIQDSGSKYLIADRSLMSVLPDYQGNVLYTDEIASLPALGEEEERAYASTEKHRITPENDALIIYSSGTTGTPKGSVLQHKSIVCFYHNYTQDVEMGSDSNVATYASFGFDGGAQDVLCAPMAGAALYVIPDEIRLDLSKLEEFYCANQITSGFMTTQVGVMFISATKCRSLRYFFVGGEKLIPVVAPDWICFRNGYGPSETMCYVNKYVVKNTGKLQPIGLVSRNIKEYIIDRFGNRLPFGACGELCISGGQMGRGYLNRPEKTAEVFVANPFCQQEGYRRMYRTGDVVRLLPDGNYDFVGRKDGQVKIRGFRIEISEVEQQIRLYPGVEKAVVRAFDNPAGGKFLAGYVVMEGKLDTEALKAFIAKDKPEYMVPAVLMQIDEIPLTSNGKLDTRKLPKPELGSLKKGAEPANETEEAICRIFADVLGTEKVYADDDFFKIGGSSISAIQVTVKCEQQGFNVVFKNLFANPTPQMLSAFIHGSRSKDIQAQDLEKNETYDYSALKYNVIANLPQIRNDGVGDVLLTGVTGFLGSHLFKELMETTKGKVICLVRSKENLPAENRFEMMMTYYFEDWYQPQFEERTTIIDGELEDKNLYEKLKGLHFDTILNSAANVKHFAAGEEMLSANYSGVENLIQLAEKTGAKLIQISSLSVCGESVNGSIPADYLFRECDLNIGQSLENKYIYTKYMAEQALINAVSRKKIRGKIIRLGNLMARLEDSEFQLNAASSGFLRTFVGYRKLSSFPVDELDSPIEFSPIDATAKAVVLLSGTPDEFTVFHAKNCNTIHYSYFLEAVRKAGRPIEIVENAEFERRLNLALERQEDVSDLGGLLTYKRNDDEIGGKGKMVREKVNSGTTFTVKALYRLGFAWPLITGEYLDNMVRVLNELNFF